MWIDITYLEKFYNSELGEFTQSAINERLDKLWDKCSGKSILGLGYAIPYLNPLISRTDYVTAAMPSYQGASPWPTPSLCKTVLVQEHELPFKDNAFDKILLSHMMGYTVHIKEMLREAWRVLAPNGEIIIIVPNRFGLWSHMDKTPFSRAMPYSVLQLKQIVIESCFLPVQIEKVLYAPPLESPQFINLLFPIERAAQKWIGFIPPGVIIMKAVKQVYAPLRRKAIPNWTRALAPQ